MGKYLFSKSQDGGEWILPEVSYFMEPNTYKNHPGLQFWPWSLGRYGFDLSEIDDRSLVWHPPKNVKKPNLLLNEDELHFGWLRSNAHLFAIEKEYISDVKSRFEIDDFFNVIHIRRGDYVRIDSQLINHDSYLNLIDKIQDLLCPLTLIISDDGLVPEQQEKYSDKLNGRVVFLSEAELPSGVAHDLMRVANVLVTANSTFSYSAAILNLGAKLIVSPISHARGDDSRNTLTKLGSWFIHNQDYA